MYELIKIAVFSLSLVGSNGFMDSLYGQLGSTCAQPNTYACRNSQCIDIKKVCDGTNDCGDNSDEEDCAEWTCTSKGLFKCQNKVCISKAFLCDGDNDCGDYSDEKNCEVSNTPTPDCNSDEWMCSTDRMCISKDFLCNGENDCVDGSDETLGCEGILKCTSFLCKNGHCIPNEWRCDGSPDCTDQSDEQNCQISPEDCTADERRFLCANNQTCITMDQVCNKITDCPDKSDEGIACANPTNTCANHNCSHDCVMMPDGPKCLCPKGFHTVDEKTCVDIDECKTYGICDQKCKNTPGSYECSCGFRYTLQSDNKTCRVTSGQAVMYFSSKTEIRSYFLYTKQYTSVATNLKQVVGIASDGFSIYWTDVFSEHESIFKAADDGSKKELLITSGLGAPEDLAIDWITGNIYFTDSEYAHIGVCTHNALHCTVIINKDIKKPRGIVVNPEEGMMYWTDWGNPAEIARSFMDGSEDIAFVSNDIYWPNGLALDYPNERLYWVDAKKKTIESIKLDGTDRYIVLEDIIKHPYAIAVFEDKLFWSDWKSHSIQSCNKFTGKNHTTLIKEKKKDIYGIHIQHNAIRTTTANPCGLAFCSDMCLLSGKTYRCACPVHMRLNPNNHTCTSIAKDQIIAVGSKDVLMSVSHQNLGKHKIESLPSVAKNIGAMTYDDLTQSLYVYDKDTNSINQLDLNTKEAKLLRLTDSLGKIEDLAYDNYGNNLYWCDSQRRTVEVLSLNTMARKVLIHDMGDESPQSIALVPSEGIMFIASESKSHFSVHIDRFTMDGKNRAHVIESGLVGPVKLAYDFDLHRVFFADAGTGNIESTSIDGGERHDFKSLDNAPMSLTFLSTDVFWTNLRSKRLYWANKYNNGNDVNKRIRLDLPVDSDFIHVAAITPHEILDHPCHVNNGNCSHLCLVAGLSVSCSCPLGLNLKNDGFTCYKPKKCENNEFTCTKSEMCIPFEMKCNGKVDCSFGEDEEYCVNRTTCAYNEFRCGDGSCIDEELVCDQHFDCADKSDESGEGCSATSNTKKCGDNYHRCSDGYCLPRRFLCNGIPECSDSSDEKDCQEMTCHTSQFQCKSGSCIPKHWECDHEYDCEDLSDEHAECAPLTCGPDKFTCHNGKCIDKIFKCDNADDCGDMSDETTCIYDCGINEFPCSSNKTICIPFAARCNGTSECPHDEDEHDCTNCHGEDFECTNKMCIPQSWLCDKTDDCGDNSDESTEICTSLKNQTLKHSSYYNTNAVNAPCDNGFRCSYGKCIDLKLVCNGKDDCSDGSDERGQCTTACSNAHPCQYKCIATPSGPKCACPEGFQLKGDGKTCRDILECSRDPAMCAQTCRETLGSFRCNCYDGFMLRADRMSCKGLGKPMTMLFSSATEIRQQSQADKTLDRVLSGLSAPITGLDFDVQGNYVFYSIELAGTVHRMHLANKTEDHIATVGLPKLLKIDWTTQNIYYYDADALDKSIKVCNMNLQSCANIAKVDTHSHVSSLAVDPINKWVFYTLAHWWVFNAPSSVVYKCKLDGSRNEELVKSYDGLITGLDFDLNRKRVYFVDNTNGHLGSVNYDGTDQRVLISNITKPFGLNLFEDHAYYITTSGYMGKCRLFGERRECNTFRLNAFTIEHFVINQESRQVKVANPCSTSQCSNICVPVDVGVKCLCENGGVVAEGETCPSDDKARNAVGGDRKPKFNVNSKDVSISKPIKSEGHGGVVAGILVPIFILLAAGAIFIYIKRRRSGQLNITMKFVNPIYGMSRSPSRGSVGLQPGEHEYCNPIDFQTADMEATTNNILQRLNPLVKLDD